MDWADDLWDRIGYDKEDKSTWHSEYLHLPRHREVSAEEFAPEAWAKTVEICGGEHMIHPVRERCYGDAFIVNFGSEEKAKSTEVYRPQERAGWHIDDDWYRLFLDSSGNAMTVVHCFSDIPERAGGTWLCEDGISSRSSRPLMWEKGTEAYKLNISNRYMSISVRSSGRIGPTSRWPTVPTLPIKREILPDQSQKGRRLPTTWPATSYRRAKLSALRSHHHQSTRMPGPASQPRSSRWKLRESVRDTVSTMEKEGGKAEARMMIDSADPARASDPTRNGQAIPARIETHPFTRILLPP